MPKLALAARPAAPPAGGPLAGPQRRPYTLAEGRLIAQLYPHCTAATLAQRLGRTVGSVYGFIAHHPELRKQGRP